jgi:hypothetical protein
MTRYETLQIILTSFVVAGVIITACIYGCQLSEMQKATKAATKSADAAEKAAKAAEASIETAKDISRRDQRAWLTVKSVTMTTPLAVGTSPVIEARFENTGRSPAINVQTAGAIFSHATTQRYTLPSRDRSIIGRASRSVIGPNSGETSIWYGKEPITDNAQIESIMGGTWVIYVSGSILYDDIFGNQHRTTFCYELSGREAGKLRLSAYFDGNTAD